MNSEKYPDPTADKAVDRASESEKPRRYMPQELYNTVKIANGTFRLMGYEVVSLLVSNSKTGQKYIWGEETEEEKV